ncbi:hypothetical protein AAMO2058_000523800 [Amorphochlora amoebiformis]
MSVRAMTRCAIEKRSGWGFRGFVSRLWITWLKRGIFKLYVAGEEFQDCERVVRFLSIFNMSAIIDHSKEEKRTSESYAETLKDKEYLFSQIRNSNWAKDTVQFVPIKPTSLIPPSLLEKISEISQDLQRESPAGEIPGIPGFEARLCPGDLQRFRESRDYLRRVSEMAREAGVGLLLDANTKFPHIYNTYQMYLRGGDEKLKKDLNFAKSKGCCLGIKLVRGAYMTSEIESASLSDPESPVSPILPSKIETDRQYDRCMELVLGEIAQNPQGFGLLVATHNRRSISKALEIMESQGIPRDSPSVHFAQIMGLCDNLGHALGTAGYNAHKLVLYGEFNDVFPWLLRRLDENKDSLGATVEESRVIWQGIWERLSS